MEKGLEIFPVISKAFDLPDEDIKTISPLNLAFIGDCIFDLVIRSVVLGQGNTQVNKLHKRCSALVKAQSQMKMYKLIEDELTEDEMAAFKRGRNSKPHTSAKNATMSDYRYATGFEAMLGYLYLTNQMNRVLYLVKLCLDRLPNYESLMAEKNEVKCD